MSLTVETNRHRRLDWILGGLTVAAIVSTVLGHRLRSLVLENFGFFALLTLTVLFVVMAWWRFVRARSSGMLGGRAWVSLAGCLALSLAFTLPFIPIFFWSFAPRWDYRFLMLAFSLSALLAGAMAARRVGFPLVAGGFLIAVFALILPQGV